MPDTNVGNMSTVNEKLRYQMRDCAATVAVAATRSGSAEGNPVIRGITLTSWTCVSMQPPIMSFCIRMPSRFWTELESTGRCSLCMLSEEETEIAGFFSKRNEGWKLGGDGNGWEWYWDHRCGGMPVLVGALTCFQLSLLQHVTMGDHLVWYGNVDAVIQPTEEDRWPLLYWQGKYATLRTSVAGKKMDKRFHLCAIHHKMYREEGEKYLWSHLEHNPQIAVAQGYVDRIRENLHNNTQKEVYEIVAESKETIEMITVKKK